MAAICGHEPAREDCPVCQRTGHAKMARSVARSAPKNAPLIKCPSCPGNTRFKVHAGLSYDAAKKLFNGPYAPDDMPPDWRDWASVKSVHLDMLNEAVERAYKQTPDTLRYQGRGIVMPAGGYCTTYGDKQPYFWCAHAAVWALRKVGCELPIQFWFLGGELESWMIPLARRLGVECVDARAIGVQNQMRCPWGWQLKIYAILHSPWREVMHIDADNIVTKDPSYLFEGKAYKEQGAFFWGDNPTHWAGRISRNVAERVGDLSLEHELDVESGQLVIDKEKCARALQVVKHLADHADYWGGKNGGERAVWYGDKTDFHVGFRKAGKSYHYNSAFQWNNGGFYMHTDEQGELIFQHACHRKGHLVNGHPIDNLIGNDAVIEAKKLRGESPWCRGDVKDALELVSPEKTFQMTQRERGAWMHVVAENEYRLPDRFDENDLIIDIGANVGAFSYACAKRGARRIEMVEPIPECMQKIWNNLNFDNHLFDYFQGIVWRSDLPNAEMLLKYHHKHMGESVSATTVLSTGKEIAALVPTVGLDTIIGDRPVRLLKLDCEGSEYAILYTAKSLHLVQEIVGEYHHDATPPEDQAPPEGGWPYAWDCGGLKLFLEGQGFVVDLLSSHDDQGFFFARRK